MQEEYSDLSTLESRLQQVAQRMVNRKGPSQARPVPQPVTQQAVQPDQNPAMGLGTRAANGLSPTMGNASSATSEQGSFSQDYPGQQPVFPSQQTQLQSNSLLQPRAAVRMGMGAQQQSNPMQNNAGMQSNPAMQNSAMQNHQMQGNLMPNSNMQSNPMQSGVMQNTAIQGGQIKLEQSNLSGLNAQVHH